VAAGFLVPSARGGGLPEADQGAIEVIEVGGEAHVPDSWRSESGRFRQVGRCIETGRLRTAPLVLWAHGSRGDLVVSKQGR
jgi:hypothetical protein